MTRLQRNILSKGLAEMMISSRSFCCNHIGDFDQHNVLKKIYLILFGLTFSFSLIGQNDNFSNNGISNSSYYGMCQLSYANSPIGKTFGSKGVILTGGFNVSRFFTKKIVAGIVFDLKPISGLSKIKIRNNFLNDFNDNYTSPLNSSLDSANASVVRSNLNSHNIRGNNIFNIGIMFSLYPQSKGAIMMQIKTGSTGFQARDHIFDNIFINQGLSDKYPIEITNNWIYEMSFKPLAFFKNTYINLNEIKMIDMLKTLTLSLYYERLNFKNASFNKTDFNMFLSNNFINKYRIDHRFGFKIGFSLY